MPINNTVAEPHWTDIEFMKLAKKYRFGWLRHSGKAADDTPSSDFKGFHNLNELKNLYGGDIDHYFPPATNIFYSITQAESCRGMPPHHHYMAFIFPTQGDQKPQWWVLGYVVELWRYKL